VQAAQLVAQILARSDLDCIEQRSALGGFRLSGSACLDDRNVIVVDTLCRTHSGAKILGADAPVHTRHKVGAGQQVMERLEHGGFHFGR
jgi:hypothetical protein